MFYLKSDNGIWRSSIALENNTAGLLGYEIERFSEKEDSERDKR